MQGKCKKLQNVNNLLEWSRRHFTLMEQCWLLSSLQASLPMIDSRNHLVATWHLVYIENVPLLRQSGETHTHHPHTLCLGSIKYLGPPYSGVVVSLLESGSANIYAPRSRTLYGT